MVEDVGEVLLALCIVGAQVRQAVAQDGGVENVDAGVDLADQELFVRGVAVLDDSGDLSAGAHDPPVARRILHLRGQHRDCVALGAMDGDEPTEGFAREQWHISVRDHHLPLEVRQLPQSAGDRMPGAQLLLLNRRGHVLAQRLEVFQDLDALMPHHDHEVMWVECRGRRDGVAEHRLATQLMEQFGTTRLHPCSTTGGQDDDRCDGSQIAVRDGQGGFLPLVCRGLPGFTV